MYEEGQKVWVLGREGEAEGLATFVHAGAPDEAEMFTQAGAEAPRPVDVAWVRFDDPDGTMDKIPYFRLEPRPVNEFLTGRAEVWVVGLHTVASPDSNSIRWECDVADGHRQAVITVCMTTNEARDDAWVATELERRAHLLPSGRGPRFEQLEKLSAPVQLHAVAA